MFTQNDVIYIDHNKCKTMSFKRLYKLSFKEGNFKNTLKLQLEKTFDEYKVFGYGITHT